MKKATEEEHAYYHLLSGVDLPIKTQKEIHKFFERNQGREFIRIDPNEKQFNYIEERIRYYHIFQELIGRRSGVHIAFIYKLEQCLLFLQKKLKINRLNKEHIKYYKGTNWFSITHEMAQYVLGKEKEIKKNFSWGLCADEIFLQTIAMNSPYREKIADRSMRLIDWKRGNPYTYRIDDYELLINDENLFARKFDYKKDPEIVNKLYDYIKKGCV